MCKLHGVRLVKGIKIFESMLKNQNVPDNTARCVTSQHQFNWSSIFIQTDISVP